MHLFDHWKELEEAIREKDLFLFLDYDGTLAPIAPRPECARLPDSMRSVLTGLKDAQDVSLAVVSGRSLAELKAFVGVPGLFYVGNHGFEIEGPGFKHTHPGAFEATGTISEIADRLTAVFADRPEVLVENKTFTLSLHYRQVPDDKAEEVRMIFLKAVYPDLDQGRALFTEGKKVLEVRPALAWNKGAAVLWLYGRKLAASFPRPLLPVYVGDDETDETALKAVKDCGIGIKVAEHGFPSHARYRLCDTGETREFLERIRRLRRNLESEGRI